MKDRLEEVLRAAVAELLAGDPDGTEVAGLQVEVPREASHGDFACNAAMLLAKRLRKPPREIAGQLVDALAAHGDLVERAEIAGPGFVNIWLATDRFRDQLVSLLAAGPDFGRSADAAGTKVQVEFVSANPTGPLSLGHGRQAVLGDCIARLLDATGHDVTREYYFNNGGRQMRVLGQSVRARYLEALGLAAPPREEELKDKELPWPETINGLPVEFPRDGYQGDYIADIAAGLRESHGDSLVDEPAEGLFRERAEETIFAGIRRTTDSLGIAFDVYFNETTLYEEGRLDEAIRDLSADQLVYEKDGATWLRATQLGLARDRVLIKSTGEPTYLLPDIAYHREKFRRGFDTVIDLQGADHIDQFPYVRAAAAALGCDGNRIELVMNQFVTLRAGGRSVKQSTRAATFVTVDELVEDVGVDVFRFFMIQRKPEGHLDFDLDLAKETDWTKNPAYYLQYTHARTCGIEREAEARGLRCPAPEALDVSPLVLPEELALVRQLASLPEVVAEAATSREPHHIAYFLRDVAGLWNPYLQDGKRHRILGDDEALSVARLALAAAVRVVMANGLALLGMSAPERM